MEVKLLIPKSQNGNIKHSIYALNENIKDISALTPSFKINEETDEAIVQQMKDVTLIRECCGDYDMFSYKHDFIYKETKLIVVKLKYKRKLHKYFIKLNEFRIESIERLINGEPSIFLSDKEIENFAINSCSSLCIKRSFMSIYKSAKFDFETYIYNVEFEHDEICNDDFKYIKLSKGIKVYQETDNATVYIKILSSSEESEKLTEFTKVCPSKIDKELIINGDKVSDFKVNIEDHVKINYITSDDISFDDRKVRLTGERNIKILNVFSDLNIHRRKADNVKLKIKGKNDKVSIEKELNFPLVTTDKINKMVIYKKRILDPTLPIFPIKKDKFLLHVILRNGSNESSDYTCNVSFESEDSKSYFLNIEDNVVSTNKYLYTICTYDEHGREGEPVIIVK